MSNIFFTSDHHFDHRNIIKFQPATRSTYQNVEEMNETLIYYWNDIIKPEDIVYYLGDFGFGTENKINEILQRLNGKIHYIRGNHDKTIDRSFSIKKRFESYDRFGKEITIDGNFIVLSHYCFEIWNRHHYGSWNLYGHSHGSYKDTSGRKRYDVGVDNNNMKPISYEEVRDIMDKKEINFIDQHINKED